MRHLTFTEVILKRECEEVKFANIAEAADALQVSKSAVYQAIKNERPILGWDIVVKKNENNLLIK